MQGIGSTIDVQSLLDTMSFFCEFQVHPLMTMKEMDDDCQRGMYRSYHILLSLMECKAIEKIRKGSLCAFKINIICGILSLAFRDNNFIQYLKISIFNLHLN